MGCCGSIINTAFNGAVGLTQVALRVGIAEATTIQQRLDICRECDFSTKNKSRLDKPTKGLTSLSMCIKCHCNIKAKTQLRNQQCPIEKW